jgi:uncharacterized protein YciI
MAYFVVSASLRDPLPVPAAEVEERLPEHKEFISRGIRDNRILCAGPKTSGNGGFIIIKAGSRAELEDFISTDPYFQHSIQHYDMTEFTPYDYQQYLEQWID